MSIIIFIIILAVLILVHEFGHFIVAKKSGIRVDEFGLGFPPKIFSKKWGSTLYTLNAIPFGGFVKIFGENAHTEGEISDADKKTSFVYKPKWIQALVLIAGITFNLIFAWLLVSLGFVIGLPSPVEHTGIGKVINPQVVITDVLDESPAQKAGLKPGDTIISVSSGRIVLKNETLTPENIEHTISESTTENIDISYKRKNQNLNVLHITPSEKIVEGKKAIGIAMDFIGTLKLPIHTALLQGAITTWLLIKGTIVGLGHFFIDLVRFKSDFSQISGPVGIATVVGEATKLGFVYLLTLTSVISINLAIINLLPLPALDGGRLLFVAIEAIIRRPISPKVVSLTNTIGFALLILLMVVVTTHDILKLL